jgi:hypothetical protein
MDLWSMKDGYIVNGNGKKKEKDRVDRVIVLPHTIVISISKRLFMTDPYIVSWGPTTKQIAKFFYI